MASLAPILKKSQSADGLTCRRPQVGLHKSDSAGALLRSHGCPPAFHLPCNLPLSPPGAAWRALSAALIDAFDQTDEISPSHPAAACMKGLDVVALAKDLAEEQCWVQGAYTRTTVLKGNGFEAMLLCWPPQACSPVHAHSDADSGVKSNCFMAILEGELTETLYAPHEMDGTRVVGDGEARALPAGASAYINDEYGVHKVGNDSLTTPAVSLHVYAPGWSRVQIYEELDAGGAPLDADWGDF